MIAFSAAFFIGAGWGYNRDAILAWILTIGGCSLFVTAAGMMENHDNVISVGMLLLLLCMIALLVRADQWRRHKQSR